MARVVVITGGTAGVGRAVARRFADGGDTVAVIARDERRLAATVTDIEQRGAVGLAIAADVADAAQVEAAAVRVERELGPIDVWINNAMVTVVAPVTELAPDELSRVTDVCYHGTVWGTQAALRRMKPRGHGVIIQVGSALAYRSIPLQAAYCGAKHAIHGFTDSLRSELAHDGCAVRLCMVQLPAVNTPQFDWCLNKTAHACQPVPPIFQPEVIAAVVYRAAAHPRREMFVGWSAIEAIVGNKLAPGFADRVLARKGYSGQLTDEPNHRRTGNLWSPAAGERGAHGRFDDRARDRDAIARVAAVLGAAGTQTTLVAGAALVIAGGLAIARKLTR